MKILKTKNYKLFKDLLGNRIVNGNHTKSIALSMNKKFLPVPIFVNEKMEVIDGQHRLQAVSMLGLHVYYIVYDGWGIKEANILNVNNKNWTISDFVDMYVSMGYPEYIKLKAIYESYDNRFGYSTIVNLMKIPKSGINEGGGYASNTMKTGNFHIPKITLYKTVLDTSLRIYQLTGLNQYYSRSMIKALSIILQREDVSISKLLSKIEENKFMVGKRNTYYQYLDMFQDIYNRNARRKIRFI